MNNRNLNNSNMPVRRSVLVSSVKLLAQWIQLKRCVDVSSDKATLNSKQSVCFSHSHSCSIKPPNETVVLLSVT